jgi:hypothetical protein
VLGHMRPAVARCRVLTLCVNIGLKEEDNKHFMVYGFCKVSGPKSDIILLSNVKPLVLVYFYPPRQLATL